MVKFYVAEEIGKALLGFDTAKLLNVLKIGIDNKVAGSVNVIDAKKECKPLSKIKEVVVAIPIKADIDPVVQPYRRVLVTLEKLVDDKIDKLLQEDIIEPVKGVSKWVSPLVVVPKGTDDVRICVDMRRANLAVERENHPLPTMDDFLPHLGQAKWFSKLDIAQAYHQV